jgi:hypothetical protein
MTIGTVWGRCVLLVLLFIPSVFAFAVSSLPG